MMCSTADRSETADHQSGGAGTSPPRQRRGTFARKDPALAARRGRAGPDAAIKVLKRPPKKHQYTKIPGRRLVTLTLLFTYRRLGAQEPRTTLSCGHQRAHSRKDNGYTFYFDYNSQNSPIRPSSNPPPPVTLRRQNSAPCAPQTRWRQMG